ncbi:DUF4328 domain-containing protein [Streptomyces sp. CA-249302]|uniref:DUF4328 domain-containing protein n=1 Tax=Streptomyces sp. CA-249302 TaxID=3240058 RepID=UPI003D8C2C98
MTMPSERPDGRAAQAPWTLARFAQGAIAVAAAAEVYRAVMVRAHDLDPVGTPESRSGFASMVSVYATTAAAALFLTWQHRARRNARAISPGVDLGHDVWAVAGWLIPLVNFWVPRGLLLGTMRASAPAGDRRGEVLVNAWWGAWAAHVAVGLFWRSSTSLPLLVASEVLNVVAAVLILWLIQRITSVQSGTAGSAGKADGPSRSEVRTEAPS